MILRPSSLVHTLTTRTMSSFTQSPIHFGPFEVTDQVGIFWHLHQEHQDMLSLEESMTKKPRSSTQRRYLMLCKKTVRGA